MTPGRIAKQTSLRSSLSLNALAEAIVHAFGFEFDHAFGFYTKLTVPDVMRSQPKYELFADMGEETTAKSVRKTPVADAFPSVGHTMLFMFDYGDDWRFVVEVIGRGQKAPRTRYPKVLKKVGNAPEQYGVWDDDDTDEDSEPCRLQDQTDGLPRRFPRPCFRPAPVAPSTVGGDLVNECLRIAAVEVIDRGIEL